MELLKNGTCIVKQPFFRHPRRCICNGRIGPENKTTQMTIDGGRTASATCRGAPDGGGEGSVGQGTHTNTKHSPDTLDIVSVTSRVYMSSGRNPTICLHEIRRPLPELERASLQLQPSNPILQSTAPPCPTILQTASYSAAGCRIQPTLYHLKGVSLICHRAPQPATGG